MTTNILLANLEKFRIWKGWKKGELYAYLNICRSTLHAWRSGKSIPSMQTLEHIAQKLGITLSELLSKKYHPGKNSPEKLKNENDRNKKLKDFQNTINKLNTDFSAFMES